MDSLGVLLSHGLAKCDKAQIVVHVDDVMFTGSRQYWNDVFLKTCKSEFNVSYTVLGKENSINFFRRKFELLDGGLLITPGTSVSKVVDLYEQNFGSVRL